VSFYKVPKAVIDPKIPLFGKDGIGRFYEFINLKIPLFQRELKKDSRPVCRATGTGRQAGMTK